MFSLIIIDDEERIRRGLRTYIPWKEMGFEVIAEAENGQIALDIIRRIHVDVMLCDIRMPVMDGIQLVEKLRWYGIECKIVFLTAYTDYELMRKAIQLGVRDYVQKPVETNELCEIFKRLYKELSEANTAVKPMPKYNGLMHDVMNYIEENYAFVQLKDLEDYTGVSRFYISKLFLQETGIHFNDYLRKIKLKKSAELLEHSYKLKVYEVSDAVGYKNYKSFSKAFIMEYGMTPSEYRNATQK